MPPAKSSFLPLLLALGIFLLLSVAMTWPLAAAPGQAYAPPAGDFAFGVWNFWWTAEALEQGGDLLRCDRIFHPDGASLAWRDYPLLVTLPAAPITRLWGPLVAYNLSYLATFVIAGFGAFLLCRFLSRNFWAALGGGIVFAFTPWHFLAYGQHATCHIEWLPLLLLALLRLRQDGRWAHGLWAGLWLACTLHSNLYYGLYAGLGLLLVAGWVLCFPPPAVTRRRLAAGFAVCACATLLLFAPRWIPMLREASTLAAGAVSAGTRCDLLGLSIPLPSGPQLLSWPAVFGYTTLAGAAATLLRKGRRRVLPAWLAGAFFLSLALGSTLRVAGREIPAIPMPMDLLRRLPFLASLRASHRALIFVALILAVLFAIGLARFLAAPDERTRRRRTWLGCVALVLLTLELWPERPVAVSTPSAAYYRRLAQDLPGGAVLPVPLDPLVVADALNAPMYWQTLHGKPLVSGFASRPLIGQREALAEIPVLAALLSPAAPGKSWHLEIPGPEQARAFRQQLRRWDVDTVILDRRYLLPAADRKPGGATGYQRPSFSASSFLAPLWWGRIGQEIAAAPREAAAQIPHRSAYLPVETTVFLEAILGPPAAELEDGTVFWRLD